MSFVYPGFLYALFALAIPIIVHLFNFKKFKRIEFSNVAFLKEIKQESKSKSRLKEWLILLSRLLAIAFLVVAFAQPYLPVAPNQKSEGDKTVSIYLDNSFSMNANGSEGGLLDMAKQYVYKIMDSYPQGQKFQLVTNDLSQSSYRSFGKASIEDQLAKLEDTPNHLPFLKASSIQEKWLLEQNTSSMELYVISDFQKSTFTDLNLPLDSNINYRWLKLEQANGNNLFIDSVWIEAPSIRLNEEVDLHYRVRNAGSQDLKGAKLSLTLNGIEFGTKSMDVNANLVAEGSFSITPTETGFFKGKIAIEDHPITYDNSWYFSYKIEPTVNVIILNENDTSELLANIYSNGNQFKNQQFTYHQFNFSSLKKTDIIVLNGLENVSQGLIYELKSFAENGGVICILPSLNVENNNAELFELLAIGTNPSLDTTNRKAIKIKYDDPFFKDVFEQRDDRIDLPSVFNSLRWETTAIDNSTQLLSLENERPLLCRKQLGKGKIFVWSSNLASKNSGLAEHSIFLLSLYKIGLSKSSYAPLSHSIRPAMSVTTNYEGPSEFLKLKTERSEFLPEIRRVKSQLSIWPHEHAKTAGFYELMATDSTVAVFAFNYARNESNLDFWPSEKLEEKAKEHSNLMVLADNFETFEYRLNELTNGVKYWKWMIVFALLMLLIEILLIKFWRN